MTLTTLHQFFVLYTWFGLVLLVLFVALIARFYERFSGVNTYFRWYIVPVLLLGMSAVRDASTPPLANDLFSDALLLLGGGAFLAFTLVLARHMLAKKHD